MSVGWLLYTNQLVGENNSCKLVFCVFGTHILNICKTMLANRHCFWRFLFCFAPSVLAIHPKLLFSIWSGLQTTVNNHNWIKYKSYEILWYYIISKHIWVKLTNNLYIFSRLFKLIRLQTWHTHLWIESLTLFKPTITVHSTTVFLAREVSIHFCKIWNSKAERVIHVNVPMLCVVFFSYFWFTI